MKIQIVNHLGSSHDGDAMRIAQVAAAYSMLVCGAHELALCPVQFKAGAQKAEPGWVELGLFENPDVSGALGYHDIDPRGQPYGRAFLSVVPGRVMLHDPKGRGASLAGVVTHELAEMLGDRFANVWAFGTIKDPRSRKSFTAVAYELADPVQDAAFTMKSPLGNVDVDCSDFVLPTWFNPDTPAHEATSHMGTAHGPFNCAPGGYLIVANETNETQVFGRRLGARQDRVMHADTAPAAWREAARQMDTSRFSRRCRG